jgi:RNA polymerase sigma-54 factor
VDRKGESKVQGTDSNKEYAMKNKISQHIKLSNKLILTNKMLLSLHLLEENVMDLEEEITEVVEENPFLELDFQSPQIRAGKKKASENSEDVMENTGTRVKTLRSHLIEQIYALNIKNELEEILLTLVDLLDIHGFLTLSASEIADEFDFEEKKVKEMIQLLKTLNPPGVGCKDVKEALSKQTNDPKVKSLIENIEELQRDPHNLIKKLGFSKEEFEESVKKLKSLNPYPANGFADSEYTNYVEPDIIVVESNGKFSVFVNEIFNVQLSASNVYEKLMESGDEGGKKFAKELFEKAKSFVDSLNRRRETLLKLGKILVEKEESFLRGSKVVPLRISEIANEIELSLSTVARAVSTKYIKTPRGVYPLKFFFSRAVYASNNGKVSRDEVKDKIKYIVDNEDKKKPLTDEQIVKILKSQGIKLSRRVVSKYREELMIPSSNKRRMK